VTARRGVAVLVALLPVALIALLWRDDTGHATTTRRTATPSLREAVDTGPPPARTAAAPGPEKPAPSDRKPITGIVAGVAVTQAEIVCERVDADAPPSIVRTAPDGTFRIPDLTPGIYALRVVADGFMLDQNVPRSGVRMPMQVVSKLAAPGDEVQLTLVGVRTFRVHLIRNDTRRPAASSVVTMEVSIDPERAPFLLRSYDPQHRTVAFDAGAAPIAILAPDAEPGSVTGYVPFDGVAPERADLRVRAEGFLPAQVTIALQLPSETDAYSDVFLTPIDAAARGILSVDCARELSGTLRPESRVLSVCRLTDGRAAFVRGHREQRDVWSFWDLPLGEVEVRVFDGVSISESIRVTLTTRFAQVRATFPPPTGASVELVDDAGRRIFDVDTLVLVDAATDRGAPNLAALTRPAGARIVHTLPPGIYRFVAQKCGVGAAAGPFTVTAGEVTRIHAVLQ